MSDKPTPISAANAMAILSRQNLQPHKQFTLHVKTLSPNKIGGTACVGVVDMYKGIDWDDGKFLIETEHQLTQLSPEDVAAIRASAKEGQSWHVYQQYKKHDEVVKDLKAKIEALTQELADAKQAARYEADVASQAIADFEEAKGKIEELEKASQWIPVSERQILAEGESVFVYSKYGQSDMADFIGGAWENCWLIDDADETITHFCRKPQNPPIDAAIAEGVKA